MRDIRIILGLWLERLIMVAVVLVAAASMYRAFWAPLPLGLRHGSFSQLQQIVAMLRQEPDPARREKSIESASADYYLIDARTPTNARVFLVDMLGRENFGQIGYYRFLTYYLFPREVAISLGEPVVLHMDSVAGRSPASVEEIKQAGYDFAMSFDPDQHNLSSVPLGSLSLAPPEVGPKPIPWGDGVLALLLPLAVAMTGSRLVRWLFKDLQAILSTGELLASGLAVGAFFLTQLTLALRLAGARMEQPLAMASLVWAACEALLLLRRWRTRRPQFKARNLWWLLLVPAVLILWSQFRLAGLMGIQELDAVEDWAFKAKILHSFAGQEIWAWFQNPALAYAHMDYPLLVPLLHALTYGALGHMNDFVIKFWNQWMLLLLAWAVLGAVRFPNRRPWLAASSVLAIVLLPMTREYALSEGATIPMLFYSVLSSVQLAIGVMEKQSGRLKLGLLLLIAAVMVKFEGILLLILWVVILLLQQETRAMLLPLRRVGWVGLLGVMAWLPYGVFRLHHPVPHPESGWMSQLLTNASTILYMAPMAWVMWVSRQFVNNDFAFWNSPDNLHAVWQGHWAGWPSLVDQMTQGVGWVCVLLLMVAWSRGGRLRWTMLRLFFVFLAFATMVSLVWCATRSSPRNYDSALLGSGFSVGGRYLYPVLMCWFVAGVVLLLREGSGGSINSDEQQFAGKLTRL